MLHDGPKTKGKNYKPLARTASLFVHSNTAYIRDAGKASEVSQDKACKGSPAGASPCLFVFVKRVNTQVPEQKLHQPREPLGEVSLTAGRMWH